MTALLAACTDAPGSGTGDAQTTSAVEHRDIALGINADLDILFVVDNSPSMAAYRDHLAEEAAPIIRGLVEREARPNLHVGVITGDPSAGGLLQERRFLADEQRWNWESYRNYAGTLPDNFAQLLDVGTNGPAAQSLISAALQALSPTTNAGFAREQSYLAVVFLTANDDASAVDIDAAAAALEELRADPKSVVVLAATLGSSPRLASFTEHFPDRSATTNLGSDLLPLFDVTNQLFKVDLTAPCIEGTLVEPRQITASLVNPETGEEARFAECDDQHTEHCWSLTDSPAVCVLGVSTLMIDLPKAQISFPAHAIFDVLVEADTAP